MKLVIVPKLTGNYTNNFGSHMDQKCINLCLQNHNINYKILSECEFFNQELNFTDVIFVGLSGAVKNYIEKKHKLKVYIWSNNQYESFSNPNRYRNVDIIFEQSCKHKFERNNVIYLPTAYQNYKTILKHPNNNLYDLIVNASLFRYRIYQPNYRRDLIEALLDLGLKIKYYNGGYNKDHERRLVDTIKNHKNITFINSWAEPKDYVDSKFSLNLPFLCRGDNYKKDWGIDHNLLDNDIWFHGWDIFRAIGAKANIITWESREMNYIGLNKTNCNFYLNPPENLKFMINEIYNIVKSNNIKRVDNECMLNNTYNNRWDTIIKEILYRS